MVCVIAPLQMLPLALPEAHRMKVLNVAEKPSVAKEISNILSSGRSRKVRTSMSGSAWWL